MILNSFFQQKHFHWLWLLVQTLMHGSVWGERWKAKLFTDFTLMRYRFPWILLLLSINFFTTLKTFTGFTSNIFMMALLLTPSRLIWRCILHNMITEGKIRLIRYNVWSSLVALMCIFQFSVLPVKSNKKPSQFQQCLLSWFHIAVLF